MLSCWSSPPRGCAGSPIVGLLVGSLTALSGTAAYTVATAATPHTGSIPTSGPTGSAMGGFGGAGGFGGSGGRRDGSGGGTGQGALPGDLTEALESGQIPADVAEMLASGELPTGAAAGGFAAGGQAPGGGQGASTNSELVALLNATTTRWSAAVTSAQSAAGYILATDTAVMGIGGFTGSDPSPTLAQFQAYVAAGDISYFIAGGAGRRRLRRRRPRRVHRHRLGDPVLGRGELHRHHGRRNDGLRPDLVNRVLTWRCNSAIGRLSPQRVGRPVGVRV